MDRPEAASAEPIRFRRLHAPATAVVLGASGGLGHAFVTLLSASPDVRAVHAVSGQAIDGAFDDRVTVHRAAITDEAALATTAGAIGAADLVIVASGTLHGAHGGPEKSLRAIDGAAMAAVFQVNTIGPALAAKHFLPLLPRDRPAVFAALSARVGSIADNRLGGWISYRASKAALNQVIKTAAIELARRAPDAVCVGLHPGTVDTALSKPFQRGVAAEKLFSPIYSVRRLLAVIDTLGPDQTGRCFAYDGTEVPA